MNLEDDPRLSELGRPRSITFRAVKRETGPDDAAPPLELHYAGSQTARAAILVFAIVWAFLLVFLFVWNDGSAPGVTYCAGPFGVLVLFILIGALRQGRAGHTLRLDWEALWVTHGPKRQKVCPTEQLTGFFASESLVHCATRSGEELPIVQTDSAEEAEYLAKALAVRLEMERSPGPAPTR